MERYIPVLDLLISTISEPSYYHIGVLLILYVYTIYLQLQFPSSYLAYGFLYFLADCRFILPIKSAFICINI